MLLSALYEQIRLAPPEVLESGIYLASPDTVPGDGIDVFVIGIGNESEEAWFLVRPASEYVDNVLPA